MANNPAKTREAEVRQHSTSTWSLAALAMNPIPATKATMVAARLLTVVVQSVVSEAGD
jgi:hypothetical protein